MSTSCSVDWRGRTGRCFVALMTIITQPLCFGRGDSFIGIGLASLRVPSQQSFRRRHITQSIVHPIPDHLFSSIPFIPPPSSTLNRRISSSSSSVRSRKSGLGAKFSMVRMTRSTEERNELVASRSNLTVVASYLLNEVSFDFVRQLEHTLRGHCPPLTDFSLQR